MSISVKIYAAYKIGVFEQNLDPARQNLPTSRIRSTVLEQLIFQVLKIYMDKGQATV